MLPPVVTPEPMVPGMPPDVPPLLPEADIVICLDPHFVEALARRRGFDPDTPPHLRKVTETV